MSPAPVTRDSWKEILASAVTIFEDLEGKGFGNPDVVIGGGTVLMFKFEHRLSKDIDFFMHDAQWLSLLTPRLNDTTAAMTRLYVEQGSTLKLVLPHGDIDFVVSAAVTDADTSDSVEFMGRTFLLEATEEILAKKLFYRAAQFQPRDVFDFVVAIEKDPVSAAGALAAAAANRDLLTRRLEQLSRLPLDRLAEGILPIGDFSRVVPGMLGTARKFVQSAGLPIRLAEGFEHRGMTRTDDPAIVAISAIANASRIPVTRDDIKRMLSTGEGEPSQIMALFSDVNFAALLRLAIAFDISDDDLARAYIHARDTYAAANPDLDAFVLEMEAVERSSGA